MEIFNARLVLDLDFDLKSRLSLIRVQWQLIVIVIMKKKHVTSVTSTGFKFFHTMKNRVTSVTTIDFKFFHTGQFVMCG